jgi:small subunit ribosomal protein S6
MKTLKALATYETIIIVKSEISEDSLLKLIEQYQGLLLERGAKNILIENRGRRHLKYPIKRTKDGIYIQLNYEANGDVVGLMERALKINDYILRYMTNSTNT